MEYELLPVISVLILLTLTLVDFHYLLLDTLWITWKEWLHDCEPEHHPHSTLDRNYNY